MYLSDYVSNQLTCVGTVVVVKMGADVGVRVLRLMGRLLMALTGTALRPLI